MRSKILVIASLAVVGLLLLVMVSAVTVFAFVGGDLLPTEETVDAAPVLFEPVSRSEAPAAEPVIEYDQVQFEGKSGCRYHQSRVQQVEKAPDRIDDQLLTQAAQ